MSMNITEAPPKPFDVITQAQRPPMSLRQVCDAIRWASVDPNVKGIVCTFSGESANSWATIQEVRDAILEFRAAQSSLPQDERRIACVAGDSFGEGGSQGTGQYYLASAFDKIYLQPSGLVGMIGLHAESYFLKDMLAKIGIKPQFFKYYEYKNAANMFTEDSFTKEHKEQSVRLFESLFRQLIEGVAQARGLDQSTVRKMVDESPLTAEEAVKHGLVDGVQYTDQVYSKIGVGKDCPLQDLAKYWKEGDKAEKNIKGAAAGDEKRSILEEGTRAITEIMDKAKAKKDEEVIALVTACGNVMRGRAGQKDMGATGVVNAIRAAVKDDKVKAIVMRVDTRGGSAVASDTIRRELEWARESGKPVVVSMGSYAASGGYYIATGADKIIAQPGTITGSIGVVLGKFTIGKVLEKLGVAVGEVDLGKRAESQSSTKPWNKEIAERAESLGEMFYKDFVGHVSKARGMTYQQVRDPPSQPKSRRIRNLSHLLNGLPSGGRAGKGQGVDRRTGSCTGARRFSRGTQEGVSSPSARSCFNRLGFDSCCCHDFLLFDFIACDDPVSLFTPRNLMYD